MLSAWVTQIAGRQNCISVQLVVVHPKIGSRPSAAIPACFLSHCARSHAALAVLILSQPLALQRRIRLCEAIVSKQTSSSSSEHQPLSFLHLKHSLPTRYTLSTLVLINLPSSIFAQLHTSYFLCLAGRVSRTRTVKSSSTDLLVP